MSSKLCKDCGYMAIRGNPHNGSVAAFCEHPNRTRSPLDGQPLPYSCEVQREMIDVPPKLKQHICGWDGRWFEERSAIVLPSHEIKPVKVLPKLES